jgi:hypothetical protein
MEGQGLLLTAHAAQKQKLAQRPWELPGEQDPYFEEFPVPLIVTGRCDQNIS